MGFLLTDPNLPATGVTGSGAPATMIVSPRLPASQIAVNLTYQPPGVAGMTGVETVIINAPLEPTDGVVVVNVGTTPVTTIETDSRTFVPALDPADPQIGEFIQNPYTGEAILYTDRAITIPLEPTDGVVVVNVGTTTPVVAITANSRIFVPALDPADPQIGEFIQNPYTGEAILYTDRSVTGIVATVRSEGAVQNKTLITGPLPEWFYRFPLTGQFSISLGFEQQPSGSLAFDLQGRNNLLAFLAAFRPATRIPMFGYGLRVTNVQFTQQSLGNHPQGVYSVQVSLSGSNDWEMGQPVPVGLLTKPTATGLEVFRTRSFCTLQELAAAAGASLAMPDTEIWLRTYGARDTLVPDTEFKKHLRHQGLFADYCAETIVARDIDNVTTWRYSDADLLEDPSVQYLGRQAAQMLSSTLNLAPVSLPPGPLPTNIATVGNFSLQPEDPALLGHANEFPVTQITGWFSGEFPGELLGEDKLGGTQLQAKPSWRKKPVERITLAKGDLNPTSPPADTTVIKGMSLCYLNSGPTKVYEDETTENGTPVQARTKVYGFIYLSRQVAKEDEDGEIKIKITSPGTYWRLVRETTTTWVYDPTYGYELGTITTGRELFAFLTESDNLETYHLQEELRELEDTNVAAISSLLDLPAQTMESELSEEIASVRAKCRAYNIEWKDIREVTGRILRLSSADYQDIKPNEGKYIEYEYLGPDGKPYYGRVVDPNHAPPYHMIEEIRHDNSFDSMPNPEIPKEDADGKLVKLPDLTTGRESFTRTKIDVIPGPESRKLKISYPSPVVGQIKKTGGLKVDESTQPDRYKQFVSQMGSEGSSFKDMVVTTTFSEHVGRPGTANRKSEDYEQEEPEENFAYTVTAPRENTQRDYIVTSPGYNPKDEPRESQSYPYAKTKDQAKLGLRTDAIVAEITNPSRTVSITVPINLQIRPGDRVSVILSGIIYPCRVNRVSHQGSLLGVVDGKMNVEGTSNLDLAPDREPDYTWTEIPKPSYSFMDVSRKQYLIYDNRLISSIRTRRNF